MGNKQLTKEQKLEELEDKIIYEVSKKNEEGSTLANGGCGICQRKGFPIFLVRKAPISHDYSFSGDSKNILSLAKDNREPEIDLSTHRYVYRTLRTGYVYILVNHPITGWEFLGYEVTPSGVFRHKSITDVKERNIKEIPRQCIDDGNHHIPGSFINIDTTVYKGDAYIAYTRRAWSQGEMSTINKYLKLMNNELVTINLPSRTKKSLALKNALQRFTKINLSQEAFLDPEKLTDKGSRSFSFSSLTANNLLLELAADPKTIHYHQDKEIEKKSKGFVTAHKFNSLRDKIKDKNTNSYSDTTSIIDAQIKTFEKSKKYKVPVVIIEDPFGIAEELSLQRQLKIEPITQMIVRAETVYSEKIAKTHENAVSSTIRLDTQFKNMIDAYQVSHQGEGSIIYDGAGQTREKFSRMGQTFDGDVIGDNFLADDYYKNYGSIIESGISYGYFNEKRLHLRKTLSLINEYRNQIESTEIENAKDIVYYDYRFTGPEISSNFIMSNYYLSRGYEELEISEENKKKHLAEMNKGWFNLNHYYDVRAFRQNNTAVKQAEKKIAKEKQKYDSLLASWRESDFIQQDKLEYEALTASVTKHSQDFFYYITWLFGYDKCSKFAPEQIKTYNDCYFWHIECDTNASNNHAGYFGDFLKLIDFTCLGNTKSSEQAAVWDMLLSHKDSIYYHLLNGQKESLWELVLNSRLDNLTKELSQYTDVAEVIAQNANKTPLEQWNESVKRQEEAEERLKQQTQEILQKFETEEYANKLDKRYFWEKGQLILNLCSMLVARAASGIANRPYEEKESDAEKIKKQHFMHVFAQSALVIRGDIIFYFQLENVPANELHYVMKYFSSDHDDSSSLPQVNYTVSSANSGATINWDFVQVSADSLDLLITLAEVATDKDVLKTGAAFAEKLKIYFTLPPSTTQLESAIKLAILNRSFKDLKTAVFAKVKDEHGKPIHQVISEAELKNSQGSVKEISFSSAKLFISGLNAAMTQISYNDNLQKLVDSEIGETLRLEIKRDVTFGFYKVIAVYTNLVNEALSFANLTIPDALRASLQTNLTIKTLTNGLLKTTAAATAFLGVVTSLITISEGFFIIQKGMKKAGSVGSIYIISGGLQMLAGVASLIQSIGLLFFASPIGLGLFVLSLILGVVASILLYVFEDESDDWNKMQHWFNCCLFGKWEHQDEDKPKPYPPSYDGMAMAINDYLVARMGLNAVIQLEEKPLYYVKSMRQYLTGIKELPQHANTWEQKIAASSRELYISISLPNYRKKISEYEGVVRLFSGESNELATMNIIENELYPEPKLTKNSPTDLLIQRTDPLVPVVKESDLSSSKVGKLEYYGDAINPKTDENLGYFKIFYKVGEYYADKQTQVYLQVKYWPQGKKTIIKDDKTSDTNKPLLISYTYKHGWNAFTGLV